MTRPEVVLTTLIGALFAIWPVPHTISLRELLLVSSALVAGYLYYRVSAHGPRWREIRAPLVLIVALTVWMLFVAVFISNETRWSLAEVRGQWAKALVALAIGGLAAAVLGRNAAAGARLLQWLCGILFIHIVAVDVDAMAMLYAGETSFRVSGLTEGPDKANYLTNIGLALLLAETLVRLRRGARLLPIANWVLGAAFVLTLFSFYAAGVRNGIGVAMVMFICWAVLSLSGAPRRHARKWLYLVTVVSVGAASAGLLAIAGAVKPGSGWRQFIATVPVAWDTQSHQGWLNESKYGLPTLPDGGPVDPSAYLRIAWFKEGLMLARDNPLGVGFGRNAFGHVLTEKYGEPKSHSHSSFIDLLVGIGVPGLALWFGFLGSLAWFGLRRLRETGSIYPLALFFVVVDFGVRAIVDSNVRDHMLQMFMFLVGLLGVLAARPIAATSTSRVT